MGQSVSNARLLLGSFAALILAGAILLLLPASLRSDAPPMAMADALFLSTSAVSITGLATRSLSQEFTFFGQVVILVLIQAGGLGLLTFANLTLAAVGRRLGLGQRGMIEDTFGNLPHIDPRTLVRRIVGYTFLIESVGAILLTFRFAVDYPFGTAVWYGIFHSISAFCNAGFSLFDDNLAHYADDIYVNAVVMALVVLGGIGFLVFVDVRHYLKCRYGRKRASRPRLSYHTRVTLYATGMLLLLGTMLIAAFEWPGMATANDWRHFLHAGFLSVASRTAGFNTVETTYLTNPTILIVIILMFIGGSPGSLAGGIKTTTLAVLLALLRSRVNGRPRVELFDRTVPVDIVGKCLATFAGFLLVILGGTIAIQFIEHAGQPHLTTGSAIVDYGFEVVSATCTVGLSLGVTESLSWPSKLVLVLCMYLGRLGPIVAAGSLIGQRPRGAYTLPEERLLVG
jgi:trk system potassium uptake protein TrkH